MKDYSYIIELSEIEHNLVLEGLRSYGALSDVAASAISLLACIKNADKDKGIVFSNFTMSCWRDFNQALLSVIRKHWVQSFIMVRHGIESSKLGCYSLHKQDKSFFEKFKDDSFISHDRKRDAEIEEWFLQNFPSHYNFLKEKISLINKSISHPNLENATFGQKNQPENNKKIGSFFDVDTPDEIVGKSFIFGISIIAADITELFLEITKQYSPIITIRDNIESDLKLVKERINALRKTIRQ